MLNEERDKAYGDGYAPCAESLKKFNQSLQGIRNGS
jgi:hypothetical protein